MATMGVSRILVIILAFFMSAMNLSVDTDSGVYVEEYTEAYTEEAPEADSANPIATITMADGGVIVLELYPDVAPVTVQNFVELANSGYYDGLTFHRVISGFMIQGGCPIGNGTGGPGYTITGEFAANGVENNLSHTRGVISMARAADYNSGGSQFFIMHADGTYLDGQYAAFGCVISGIEVVDAIAAVNTDYSDKPVEPVIIESIRVDNY